MGFWGLIWASIVGASATKHAIDNSWCKNNLKHTLPNGVEYYCDADGKHRLLDGTIIMWKGYGDREKVIDVKTNRVIYDKGVEIDKKLREVSEESKKNATKNNKLLYLKVNSRCYNQACFFETKTNRQLAKVARVLFTNSEEIEYRKWYFHDALKERMPYQDLSCAVPLDPQTAKYGDKGITITQEEFNKLCQESYDAITAGFPGASIALLRGWDTYETKR